MEVTNLYAAELWIVEKIVQQFPDTFKGVIVDEVCSLLLFLKDQVYTNIQAKKLAF